MNNKFDELTKGLAQSVTRRAALKKFGVGLAGMALACFGLANKAHSKQNPLSCRSHSECEALGYWNCCGLTAKHPGYCNYWCGP